MNAPNDGSNEMHRNSHKRFGEDNFVLSDDDVDALLGSRSTQGEAPDGYRNVAALLNAAASPLTPENETHAVRQLAAAVRSSNPHPRRKRVLGHVLTAKVAAIAAGVVLSTGGAAAAATGTLPAPAQNAVSNTVEHVGVNIPKADLPKPPPPKAAKTDDDTSTSSTTLPQPPPKPPVPKPGDGTTKPTPAPAPPPKHETGEHPVVPVPAAAHDGEHGTEPPKGPGEPEHGSTTTTVKHETPKPTTTTVKHDEPKPTTTTVKHDEPKPTTTTTVNSGGDSGRH